MTRREIVDRLEVEARRRAARQAELHRPWLCDSEPGQDDNRGPQMLAFAFVYCALVLGLLGLGCWAWATEDRIAADAYCRQLSAANAAQLPTYCTEGGK